MKNVIRFRVPAFLVLLALAGCGKAFAEAGLANDAEVAARRSALELAGAFSNEGFKLRDGTFSGVLKPKEMLLIQVNLYAGNQYWFSVGTTPQAKKVSVQVFNENAQPLESESFQQENQSAAGFSPTVSGPYYISILETEGEPASFCFLYSYK
jgi:hypothetical protein